MSELDVTDDPSILSSAMVRPVAVLSGSVFRHRKTGKTKTVRYGTGAGVHWTGADGEWRYECWKRWNAWIKNAEDITPNDKACRD